MSLITKYMTNVCTVSNLSFDNSNNLKRIIKSLFHSHLQVEIPDVTLKTFLVFLEYLYTDHAPLVEGNALEVLTLANKYAVPRLMAMCEFFIFEKTVKQLMADGINQEDLDIIGMLTYLI